MQNTGTVCCACECAIPLLWLHSLLLLLTWRFFFSLSVHSSGLRLANLSQRFLCRTPAAVCRAFAAVFPPACFGLRSQEFTASARAKVVIWASCRLFVLSAKQMRAGSTLMTRSSRRRLPQSLCFHMGSQTKISFIRGAQNCDRWRETKPNKLSCFSRRINFSACPQRNKISAINCSHHLPRPSGEFQNIIKCRKWKKKKTRKEIAN